jgi:hypothetical protein
MRVEPDRIVSGVGWGAGLMETTSKASFDCAAAKHERLINKNWILKALLPVDRKCQQHIPRHPAELIVA